MVAKAPLTAMITAKADSLIFRFFIMMNAFLLKNGRKTLSGSIVPTLFKVFGFPFGFWHEGYPVQQDKKQVKVKVCGPGHMAQDPAAGAGNAAPEMQRYQCYVTGKDEQQPERKAESVYSGFAVDDQCRSDQLGKRQDVQEGTRPGMREVLVVQLTPEVVKLEQLAGCGVNEQQDKQGFGNDPERVFHIIWYCCSKVSGLVKVKTVEKGWYTH
jgi:hypothetical protein